VKFSKKQIIGSLILLAVVVLAIYALDAARR